MQSLFDATGKDIKHQFLSKQPTGERKDFHAMPFMTRRTHLFYSKTNLEKAKQAQAVGKMYKRCCRTVTNVENDCIVNEGALTVPFNMNKAVAQKFYYCLDALCIRNWPLWTNVPSLLELTFDSNITDDSKKEIFSLLNI